jgi:hypothetical protein
VGRRGSRGTHTRELLENHLESGRLNLPARGFFLRLLVLVLPAAGGGRGLLALASQPE